MRLLCALLLSLFSCADKTKVSTRNFFDLEAETLAGKPAKMEQYHGKVILVVNTASKCGFTGQYKALEAVWKKYQDRGLVIIGFPCNQFGSQEPGGASDISSFCQLNYGVTFPMMAKIEVNGPGRHEIYKFLCEESGAANGNISWNFSKFLIGRDGKVIDRYAPLTKPDDNGLIAAIEAALGK